MNIGSLVATLSSTNAKALNYYCLLTHIISLGVRIDTLTTASHLTVESPFISIALGYQNLLIFARRYLPLNDVRRVGVVAESDF